MCTRERVRGRAGMDVGVCEVEVGLRGATRFSAQAHPTDRTAHTAPHMYTHPPLSLPPLEHVDQEPRELYILH